MSVVVSTVGAAGVEALATLRAAWTAERHGMHPDDSFGERFDAWVRAELAQRTFFVATVDDEPVGMVNLLRIDRMPAPGRTPGSWGYLNNMYVRPEHRDGGIGGLLVARLLDHARDEGLRHVLLNPTDEARRFYERHGFRGGTPLMVWSP